MLPVQNVAKTERGLVILQYLGLAGLTNAAGTRHSLKRERFGDTAISRASRTNQHCRYKM
jgi:hypothetical protein